jgi:multicomponent Na+:H+ antiporter subunit G
MIDIVAKVLFSVGAFFGLVGAIGILRMPDVYNRIHAETLCVVGGTIVVLIGAAVMKGFDTFSLKALIIAVFLLVTNPVGSHALAKAAHKAGVKLFPEDAPDRLEEAER